MRSQRRDNEPNQNGMLGTQNFRLRGGLIKGLVLVLACVFGVSNLKAANPGINKLWLLNLPSDLDEGMEADGKLTLAPLHGSSIQISITSSDTNALTFKDDSGNASQSLSFTVPAGLGEVDFEVVAHNVTADKTVTVRAEEVNGNPRVYAPYTVSIDVNDLNQAPTNITLTSSTIHENQNAFTTVGSFSAVDDGGSGQSFTYEEIDEDPVTGKTYDWDFFTISGSNLRSTTSFDFEGASNSYSLRVKATDPGGLSFEKDFTINVTNVNEPPVGSLNFASPVSLDENLSAVGGFSASSPDNEALSYSFTGTDASKFTANSSTKTISFLTPPDYENPTDGGSPAGQNNYEATLVITAGGDSISLPFIVEVQPVNEPPVGSLSFASPVSLDENLSVVGGFSASSPDNEALSYSFTGTDASKFTANSSTKTISFLTPPDYENPTDGGSPAGQNNYEATLVITAGGDSISLPFIVEVQPVNEPPVGSLSFSSPVSLDENLSAVGGFSASSPDNEALSYSFTGTDASKFTANSSTKTISFLTPPDYENPTDGGSPAGQNNYEATLVITAGGDSISLPFIVEIQPVNEPPVGSLSFSSPVSLDENLSVVGGFSASSPDNEALSYSFTGTDASKFTANSSTKTISFLTPPDYENPTDGGSPAGQNNYEATLVITAGGDSISLPFIVEVQPVNEPPVGSLSFASPVSLDENLSVVGGFSASSPDNEALSYSFTGTDASKFTANSSTKTISFLTPPDYENPTDGGSPAGQNNYEATLVITAGGDSISLPFIVEVQPVNEPPVGSLSFSSPVSLDENLSAVGGFSASSPDNEALSYSFSGTDASKFTANSSTKTISFLTPPDYENPTDGGSPVGQNNYEANLVITAGGDSISLPFIVLVQPINEPPTASLNFPPSIPENTTTVGSFTFFDPEGDIPIYSLSGTDSLEFFVIGASKIVAFTSQPDFESPTDGGTPPGQNTYDANLVISAGGDSLSLPFTIGVSDVNEAPSLSLSGVVSSVDENIATPFDVATVTVVDDALGTNTPGLAGPDSLHFEWVGSTLRFGSWAELDFETQRSYEVWVQIDDPSLGGIPDDTETVTVTINDLPEFQPPTIATLRDEEFPANELFYYHGAVVIGDPDTSISSLTVSGESSDETIITDANVQVIGTGAERDLWIQPVENQFGPVMITLTVDDGTTPVPTSFQYTVLPKGIPPAETDGDTLFDHVENKAGNGVKTAPPDLSDWENLDSDGDTLRDDVELANGFDPCLRDTDGDGVDDNIEFGNTPPIAVADYPVVEEGDGDVTLNPLTNDSDTPDGDLPLVIVSVEPLSQIGGSMTIAADGQSVVYIRPGDNILGVETYDYTIRDTRGGDATATITVSLENNNLDPVISPIVDIAMPANVTWSPIEFTVVDPDGPAIGTTMTFETDNPNLFPTDSLTFSGTDEQRSLSLTPTSGQFGTAAITLRAFDSAERGEITFNVTVGPHGLLPADTDGDTLFDYAENKVGTGDVTIPPDEWDWEKADTDDDRIPDAIEPIVGTDPHNFDTDGDGVDDGVEFGNHDPIVQNESFTIEAGFTSVFIDVLANDSDPDFGNLLYVHTFQLTSSLGGTVIKDQFGNLRYTTPPGFVTGVESLAYTVTDKKGGFVDATATINVVEHNVAPGILPVANVKMPSNAVWEPFDIEVVDADGDPGAVVVGWTSDNPVLFGENGVLIEGDGPIRKLTLAPGKGRFGSATIFLTSNDGEEDGQIVSFLVDVGPHGLQPADTDLDSIPGHIEDINGDGLEQEGQIPGETNWNNSNVIARPILTTRDEAMYRLETRQLLYHTLPRSAFLRDGAPGAGSTSYEGGGLTIRFESGGMANDKLDIISTSFVSVAADQPQGGVPFTIDNGILKHGGAPVGIQRLNGVYPQHLIFDFTEGMTRDIAYQLLLSVTFENEETNTPRHDVVVAAQITNGLGKPSNIEETNIHVAGENIPPFVFAGPDRREWIQSDGSGTFELFHAWTDDPDAPLAPLDPPDPDFPDKEFERPVEHQWTVVSADPNVTLNALDVQFSDATDRNPTITVTKAGEYSLTLEAKDEVNTVTDSFKLTVREQNLNNLPPIVSAGPDRVLVRNPVATEMPVVLESTAFDPDMVRGDTLTVSWDLVGFDDGTSTDINNRFEFGASGGDKLQPEVKLLNLNSVFSGGATLARYDFEVTVTDGGGLSSSDQVSVRVGLSERTPKDIVLVLEHEPPTVLHRLAPNLPMNTAKELIRRLPMEYDQVSIVTTTGDNQEDPNRLGHFPNETGSISVQHVLSADRDSLLGTAPWRTGRRDELSRASRFGHAFRLARLELSSTRARSEAEPWIVFIGSGGSGNRAQWGTGNETLVNSREREAVVNEARKARAEGIRVLTIALHGNDACNVTVNEWLESENVEKPFLESLASHPKSKNSFRQEIDYSLQYPSAVADDLINDLVSIVDLTYETEEIEIVTSPVTVVLDPATSGGSLNVTKNITLGLSPGNGIAEISGGSGDYNYLWTPLNEFRSAGNAAISISMGSTNNVANPSVDIVSAWGGESYFARVTVTDQDDMALSASAVVRIDTRGLAEPGEVFGGEDLFVVKEGSVDNVLDIFANDDPGVDRSGFDLSSIESFFLFHPNGNQHPTIKNHRIYDVVDYDGGSGSSSTKALSFTPPPNAGGTLIEYLYRSDPNGEFDSRVFIYVDPIQEAPVAVDDGFLDSDSYLEYAIEPDSSGQVLDVLKNDLDPDWAEGYDDNPLGTSFHIVDFTQPRRLLDDGSLDVEFGTVVGVIDFEDNNEREGPDPDCGQITIGAGLIYKLTYIPPGPPASGGANQEGVAIFEYTIADTYGLRSTARVRVAVTSDPELLGHRAVDDRFAIYSNRLAEELYVLGNDDGNPSDIHSVSNLRYTFEPAEGANSSPLDNVGQLSLASDSGGKEFVRLQTILDRSRPVYFDYYLADPASDEFDDDRYRGTVAISFDPRTGDGTQDENPDGLNLPVKAYLSTLKEADGTAVLAEMTLDENGDFVDAPILELRRGLVDVYAIIDHFDPANTGSDSGQNLLYLLVVKDESDGELMRVVGATEGASNEIKLGQLDFSGLKNDSYRLGLFVFDSRDFDGISEASGCDGCAEDWALVRFESGLDAGRMAFTVEDLSIPLEGLPLRILRSYDSWDESFGDFGKGWNLGIESIEFIKPDVLGAGWKRGAAGCAVGGAAQLVTVKIGSETYRFYPELKLCSGYTASSMVFELFSSPAGRNASLRIPNLPAGLLTLSDRVTGNDYIDLSVSEEVIYDPEEFEFKVWDIGSEGNDHETTYLIRNGELVSVDSPTTGVTVAVSLTGGANDGIDWSRQITEGSSTSTKTSRVKIVYDNDVITEVYAPSEDPDLDPPTIAYEYEYRESGQPYLSRVRRLVDKSVSPAVYQVTNYGYVWNDDTFLIQQADDIEFFAFAEYLNRIGNESNWVVRNDYDEQGRLASVTSGGQGVTRYDHHDDFAPEYLADLDASDSLPAAIAVGMESIIDPLGNITRHKYDDRGNVVETQVISGKDSSIESTTRRQYKYADANSLLVTKQLDVDPTNRRTVTDTDYYTNEAPRTITVTDAAEASTIYAFDQRGRITSVKDALDRETSYTYRAVADRHFGKIQSVTLPDDTAINYNYSGNTVEIESSVGLKTIQTLDDFGYVQKTEVFGKDAAPTEEPLQVTEFEYDSNGNLLREKQTTKKESTKTYALTEYVYDSANRQLSATLTKTESDWSPVTGTNALSGPVGPTVRYNALGQHSEEIRISSVGESLITSFRYDPAGNLIETVFPPDSEGLVATESATFDVLGRVRTRSDRANRTVGFIYDPAGRVTETRLVVDPLAETWDDSNSQVQSKTVYDAAGRVLVSEDERGFQTRFAYDAVGRQAAVANPHGEATRNEYDAVGNLTARTTGLRWADTMDDSGAVSPDGLIQLVELIPTAETKTTFHDYDAQNRLIRTRHPDGGGTELFGYDGAGQRTVVVDPQLQVTKYSYDDMGRLQKVILGKTWRDRNGNGLYDSDEEFRLDQDENPIPLAGDETETEYAYDSDGNLIRYTDAKQGSSYTYEYDAFGRRTKRTLPNGNSESFVYDEAGQLKVHRLLGHGDVAPDGEGNELAARAEYEYDDLGRLKRKAYFSGRATHGIDDLTHDAVYRYTANGQRRSVTYSPGHGAPAETINYFYDEAGRLERKETPQGVLEYSYSNGNLASVTHGSNTVAYEWDASNRLKSVVDQYGGSAKTTDYHYDDEGALDAVNQNGIRTQTVSRDALGRVLDSLTYIPNSEMQFGGAIIASFEQNRRRDGRRSTVNDSIGGGHGTILNYSYDTLGRVRAYDGIRSGANVAVVYDSAEGYSDTTGYDEVGNRDGSLAAINAFDELVELTYDDQGNVTAFPGSGPTLVWDLEGRLTKYKLADQITEYHLYYDPDGNRIRKEHFIKDEPGNDDPEPSERKRTVSYLVDDLNPTGYAQVIAESTLENSVTAVRNYVCGLDLISHRDGTSDPVYYGYDALGSRRFLMDENGNVVSGSEFAYDTYGEVVIGTTPAQGDHYLYTGEQYDADLGLYYLRARYYDPTRGVFLSRDPFEGTLQDPMTRHPYMYAGNDPINNIDPSGATFITTLKSASLRAQIRVANVAGRIVPALNTRLALGILRLQQNLWKIELASAGLSTAGILTVAGANWMDQALEKAINNRTPFVGTNGGEHFERIVGANATEYEGIDHVISEPNGKKSIVSLTSRASNPDKDDDQYINNLETKMRKKGKRVASQRTFYDRLAKVGQGRVPPIGPDEIDGRMNIGALPEARAHLLSDQRMINMLRRLQAEFRNVRHVVVPVRGWRVK